MILATYNYRMTPDAVMDDIRREIDRVLEGANTGVFRVEIVKGGLGNKETNS